MAARLPTLPAHLRHSLSAEWCLSKLYVRLEKTIATNRNVYSCLLLAKAKVMECDVHGIQAYESAESYPHLEATMPSNIHLLDTGN